jgi:TetR/AcrR family transcriptional regulator, cholesterol catabolism regulator
MSTGDRRREIVRTAADLFERSGYAATTMDDIAAAVGLAKPTLYHYFTSKDRILVAIYEEYSGLLLERHEQRLHVGLSPEQMLLEVMADILELMETHRGHVRVFYERHREVPDEARAEIRRKRERYRLMVEEIFTKGVESGAFRDVDVHLARLAAFGMCNWAYQWYQSDGALRPRELAYQFWGFLVYGIGGARSGNSTPPID